jgi:nicotinate dehydrogenase subunit A
MIMTAKELLDRNPRPNAAEVREALAGNLCRCGTHSRIVRAVLRAAQGRGILPHRRSRAGGRRFSTRLTRAPIFLGRSPSSIRHRS